MKKYNSELPIFNKHFVHYVRYYVHDTLDNAKITHYIHSINDFSCIIYLGYIAEQSKALALLMSHPFAKHCESDIDFDGEAWIKIYF